MERDIISEVVGSSLQQGAYYYIQNCATDQYVKSVGPFEPLAFANTPDTEAMWYISSVGTADTYTFRSIRGWYAYSKGNNAIPIIENPNKASHWVTDLSPEKASICGPAKTTLYWNARTATDKVYADPTSTDTRESWRFIPVNRDNYAER